MFPWPEMTLTQPISCHCFPINTKPDKSKALQMGSISIQRATVTQTSHTPLTSADHLPSHIWSLFPHQYWIWRGQSFIDEEDAGEWLYPTRHRRICNAASPVLHSETSGDPQQLWSNKKKNPQPWMFCMERIGNKIRLATDTTGHNFICSLLCDYLHDIRRFIVINPVLDKSKMAAMVLRRHNICI